MPGDIETDNRENQENCCEEYTDYGNELFDVIASVESRAVQRISGFAALKGPMVLQEFCKEVLIRTAIQRD